MLVTWLLCCLVVLSLATPSARAAFGDDMDHGRDDLFEKMGKATVDVFDIVDGRVQLDIALEDTIGQDEIWILDFQPFQRNSINNRAVIQENGGSLVAENTGTCSNVFNTLPFDSSTGFYKDSYIPNIPGDKSLFSYYETGTEIIQGDMRIRENHIVFMGSMDILFNCKDSDQETVWEKEVTAYAIQFNTTLYMTNVRPQGSGNNPEPAYVQSYAILYWRLLRVALSRFIVCSTERLKPIFVYAIVGAVYLNDDEEYGFDRYRAEVQIAFHTLTDNTYGDLISVYKMNTLVYEPADDVISSISHIKRVPSSGCDRPLGVEDSNIIGDNLITASSYWLESNSLEYSPDKGRLNAKAVETISSGMWLAGSTTNGQWIQVDLPADNLWVSGVMTQGFGNDVINMWVKEYLVYNYQVAVSNFNPVLNSEGSTHTFIGNYDSHTIVTNYFDAPVSTNAIRIYPTDFENNIALRFELLVCEGHPECFTDASGADYRGTVHQTMSGNTCRRWFRWDLHTHSINSEDNRDSGIGDHNFCRNPNGQSQPWCYTLDPLLPIESCDVGTAVASCAPLTAPESDPELYVIYYTPHCNYTEWEESCTQSWLFVVVLEVDTSAAYNRMPIDATGEFTFEFETYTCPYYDRSSCSKLDVPNAIISNEITLQTTVEIVDDVKDSPRVFLKKVHGDDPTVDIRDGYRPGVSYLEMVTMDTHFYPLFLRRNLQLELTLFMVCIGREFRDMPDGCLVAPFEESCTVYVSPEFRYRLSSYSLLTADSISGSLQSLESHDYIHSKEIHRSRFINKALSALAREYTITIVYRLVERTDRKRRDIQRRDVRDKINDPIAVHQVIYFKGCPPNSTYAAKEYACICDNKGEVYSETRFKCEKSTKGIVFEEKPQEEEQKEGNGSMAVSSTISLLVGLPILLALAL